MFSKSMFLVLSLVLTFCIVVTQPVFSQAGDHDFSGTLTEINKADMTIIVKSAENEIKSFHIQTGNLISIDEKTASFDDLKTGLSVIVFYYINPGNEIEVASVNAKTVD